MWHLWKSATRPTSGALEMRPVGRFFRIPRYPNTPWIRRTMKVNLLLVACVPTSRAPTRVHGCFGQCRRPLTRRPTDGTFNLTQYRFALVPTSQAPGVAETLRKRSWARYMMYSSCILMYPASVLQSEACSSTQHNDDYCPSSSRRSSLARH